MKTNPNPSLITIINDGKNIIEPTNYWTSDMALDGYCLVSANAGCVRLLIPDSMAWQIPDMVKGAKQVVISILRGQANGVTPILVNSHIYPMSTWLYQLNAQDWSPETFRYRRIEGGRIGRRG